MHKNHFSCLLFLLVLINLNPAYCSVLSVSQLEGKKEKPVTDYVNPLIGSGGNGNIIPCAVVPFGMVQVGVDTRMENPGYNYYDTRILGVSHEHKMGTGCGDFLDILFQPVPEKILPEIPGKYPEKGFSSAFSHNSEKFRPGNYSVKLLDFDTDLSITATSRCAFHRYTFPKEGNNKVVIDLKYGSTGACTIIPKDDYDTVKISHLERIDAYSVAGSRISNGWSPEQHVYFFARFSKPIKAINFYGKNVLVNEQRKLYGTDVKAILEFDQSGELLVKVGISPVDVEGARKNVETEIPGWDFEKIKDQALHEWDKNLNKFSIRDDNEQRKELFYSFLYNILVYPMLYSDVDGRFRGPDYQVHPSVGFPYYAGVIGFWDTFRAACPLLTILRPDVANDYVRTCLAHFDIFGQLPIWTLAGEENFQMIGLHSLPFIADCYYKGIRGYDASKALNAMVTSANKDTCGFSMRYFVGLKNYKKYGYVPADLEMESVARTLEYSYDDWCVAQMAKQIGNDKIYKEFSKRSMNYKNVFDKSTGFMRGRFSNGSWRTPFDPYESNHRRDDYCEGNAWQWSFFVPHDVLGYANLMGGNKKLEEHLDSLFKTRSDITGKNRSGDISGMIGQYAHGNEPSHHVAYMYDYIGCPGKTQFYIREIMDKMYSNTPLGISGNDDTGQMSAWYVFSAMGFYPVRHGTGEYMVGTPLFKHLELKHEKGKLVIEAPNVSSKNRYIKSIRLNGKKLNRYSLLHNELFNGNVLLEFDMTDIQTNN